jgi:hypothetical protein
VTPRRGRPRKFIAPSRAVTLTLPENVLAALDAVDHDLSRAVVRVTQPQMAKRPHPPAEVATFGRRGVIVVNPSRTLEERTGILLVPLTDGRALISFDESMTIARLELRIQDALDDPKLPTEDARIFKSIEDILKTARRSGDVTLQQRHIIVLESNRPAKRRAPPGVPKRRN